MNRPLLKYCGQQSIQDFELSVDSAADFLGFIFYEKSPRFVEPEAVAAWVCKVGKHNKQLVGVFVNPTIEDVRKVFNSIKLDVIQLHGTETPKFTAKVKREFRSKVWKAIHHNADSLQTMRSFNGFADGFVIDCKVNNLWGGTGQSFDWSAVPDYTKEAVRQNVICLIAGGVSPKNIDRLLAYQPIGIDMASGIENEGRKSKILIREIERKVVALNEHIS